MSILLLQALVFLKDLLLKRPWVIVIAVLLIWCGVLQLRLNHSKAVLATKTLQTVQLGAAIKEQNQSVAAWMDAAVAQSSRAEAAEKESARIRVVTATRIERVLAEPVPSDCPAAVSWGAEFGARLGTEWGEAAP